MTHGIYDVLDNILHACIDCTMHMKLQLKHVDLHGLCRPIKHCALMWCTFL